MGKVMKKSHMGSVHRNGLKLSIYRDYELRKVKNFWGRRREVE